jgi:type II secretory pathway predicted ATPase ExeA
VKAQVRTSFTSQTAGKIDEAHLLSADQLEELRLLTNAEFDSKSPFAGILVGQPTLSRRLRMGSFAAFDQRIAVRFSLAPMDIADSAAYIRHHLALVGRSDPVFADDAVAGFIARHPASRES